MITSWTSSLLSLHLSPSVVLFGPCSVPPFPTVAGQVRQSGLVQAVDRTIPDGVRTVYDNLRDAIDRRGLPDVLGPLTPTEVRDVPAPDPALRSSPVVRSVQGSSAKMISYEVAMGMSLIPVLLLSGNVTFQQTIQVQQQGLWFVLPLFLSFFLLQSLNRHSPLEFLQP